MAERRWWLNAAALILVVIASEGCGEPFVIESLPPLSDVNGVRNAVLNNLPDTAAWEPYLGDKQKLSDTLNAVGRIWPHRKAHVHGLQAGKFLARIQIDSSDYPKLGLRQGMNYWILAARPAGFDVPSGANQDFVNVFIPEAGDDIQVLPLFTNQHDHYTHGQAAARWLVNSDATTWTSCGAHMCCCGSAGCDPM